MTITTYQRLEKLGKFLNSKFILKYATHRYVWGDGRLKAAWMAFLDIINPLHK